MIELRHTKPLDESVKNALEQCWQQVLARNEIGFPRITELEADWKAIEARGYQVRPAKRVLVLGIGGSSLGTQVIYDALGSQSEFTFLESPDPDIWAGLKGLSDASWRDKHVVIVSKSGNTLETLSWIEQLHANEPTWLKNSQVTVIASPGKGALQKWAERENLSMLWIPENVGGRFSVLTAAGMFPALLMGHKIGEFRAGAAWALKRTDLASQISAEVLESWERSEWVTQMWIYSESLGKFGEWWQQLWSESLSKLKTRDGGEAPRISTPMGCRGPRDQHSLVQQLVEGPRDKYVQVLRVRGVENSDATFRPQLFPEMPFHGRHISLGKVLGAEAQAFEHSLRESRISYSTLALENLNERTMGAMFMLWQMVIAQLGEFLHVNAYDQPGVEIGKKHANQLINQ